MGLDRTTKPLAPNQQNEKMPYLALAASIALGIVGQLLMKWAVADLTIEHLDWNTLPKVMLAIGVYSLGIVNWILALKHVKLSIAYPLTSLSYVGILVGSHYIFGEHVSGIQLFGTALVFLGGILVVLCPVLIRRSNENSKPT